VTRSKELGRCRNPWRWALWALKCFRWYFRWIDFHIRRITAYKKIARHETHCVAKSWFGRLMATVLEERGQSRRRLFKHLKHDSLLASLSESGEVERHGSGIHFTRCTFAASREGHRFTEIGRICVRCPQSSKKQP
jgi:hypothetical protein